MSPTSTPAAWPTQTRRNKQVTRKNQGWRGEKRLSRHAETTENNLSINYVPTTDRAWALARRKANKPRRCGQARYPMLHRRGATVCSANVRTSSRPAQQSAETSIEFANLRRSQKSIKKWERKLDHPPDTLTPEETCANQDRGGGTIDIPAEAATLQMQRRGRGKNSEHTSHLPPINTRFLR